MKASKAMVSACSQAVEWYSEHADRRDHVESWMLRFARTVALDKRAATVARVHRWFKANALFVETVAFYSTDNPTAERIAWQLLGGEPGRQWAARSHDEAAVEPTIIEELEVTRQAWANIGARPLNIDEWAHPGTFAGFEGRRPEWAGVLTLEGIATSDGRLIREGALTWRGLPLTLQDQLQSQPGHDGAVAAGPITNIFREGQEIRGEGFFDSGEDGDNARRRMAEGTKQGVSVDLTEVEIELPDDPDAVIDILFGDGLLEILAARIGAATLVSIPAFEGARLSIVGDMDEVDTGALVASGGKLPKDLRLTVTVPIKASAMANRAAPEDVEQVVWVPVSEFPAGATPDEVYDNGNPPMAEASEIGWMMSDAGVVRVEAIPPPNSVDMKLSTNFIGASPTPNGSGVDLQFSIDTENGSNLGSYTMSAPFTFGADMTDPTNELMAITEATRQRLRNAIADRWPLPANEGWVFVRDWDADISEVYFEHSGLEEGAILAIGYTEAADGSITLADGDPRPVVVSYEALSLVASAGQGYKPPPEWFNLRRYDKPTAFVIEEPDADGLRRFTGHTAFWGSCHIGITDRCQDVPRGLDYASFQGPNVPNVVVCADGSRITAGPVVMDNVHPNLRKNASDAEAHYAHTGALVAQVRCYEDEHGLQAQGWILPKTSEADICTLNAADVSPDWRARRGAAGGRGVVCLLACPVSGFNLGIAASAGRADGAGLSDVDRKIVAAQALGLPVHSDWFVEAGLIEDPVTAARKTAAMAALGLCDRC